MDFASNGSMQAAQCVPPRGRRFLTIADIVGLGQSTMIKPSDGVSLKALFSREIGQRQSPIGFRYMKKRALVDDRYKILTDNLEADKFQLYDLIVDKNETHDLSTEQPEVFARMKRQLLDWNTTVDASFLGKDYSEGKVTPPDPPSIRLRSTGLLHLNTNRSSSNGSSDRNTRRT